MPEVVEALNREQKTYLEKRLRFAERWEETWREHPETRDLIFTSHGREAQVPEGRVRG